MATDLLIVSDTHLAPDNGPARDNWDAVVDHVSRTLPDLVLHLGDLTVSGADDGAQLRYARLQLDRLPVPWLALPGNHDLGDNPVAGFDHGSIIDEERRQRWLDEIGPDRWRLDVDGWTILGANAQLFGSGLGAEDEQWDWLARQLAEVGADRTVAMALHKPVTAPDEELSSAPSYRYVPRPAAARLTGLAQPHPLGLVLSGHVHQYRLLDLGGTRHVWSPTTWAVLPDEGQPRFGWKRCGALSLRLEPGCPPATTLVEPDGLDQLVIGANAPNPYQH